MAVDNRSWLPDGRLPWIEAPLLIDIIGEATRKGWAEVLTGFLEARFGELPPHTMDDLMRVPTGEGGSRLTLQASRCPDLGSFLNALGQELLVTDPCTGETA